MRGKINAVAATVVQAKKQDDAMWPGNLKLSMTHAVINGISDVTKFTKHKYTVYVPCVKYSCAIFIFRIY